MRRPGSSGLRDRRLKRYSIDHLFEWAFEASIMDWLHSPAPATGGVARSQRAITSFGVLTASRIIGSTWTSRMKKQPITWTSICKSYARSPHKVPVASGLTSLSWLGAQPDVHRLVKKGTDEWGGGVRLSLRDVGEMFLRFWLLLLFRVGTRDDRGYWR